MNNKQKILEQEVYNEIIEILQKRNIQNVSEKEVQKLAYQCLEKREVLFPQHVLDEIVANLAYSIIGYGPLEFYLRDDTVSEIMVNGCDQIFVERKGKIEKSTLYFTSDEQLLQVISRIVGKVGRRIDESSPLVDARLEDGSRVNAIIPPLSLIGPVLTIRKFPKHVFSLNELLKKNSLSLAMKLFLEFCVLSRKNIVVSGGTGAGKTSTLNAVAAVIPHEERIITIEDSAEIRIDHPHCISLESRASNIEGKGEIPIRILVKNSLRMRPDRIVVGEIRGGEALDMLQAMNTGHSGSLTTVHANAALESLFRIETMVLMGDVDIPLSAIRPQIIQGIDIVIQQARLTNGERKIIQIAEIEKRYDSQEYVMHDIFLYDQKKKSFISTGYIPECIKNTDFDLSVFKD